jgi:hypothetical protein
MPFTLAHPAAALPLWYAGRRGLRLAALVLGSVTPDYEYFLHLNTVGRFGHTLPGLFLLGLPAGWLSLWLFDRFGRAGIRTLLPAVWRLPAPPVPRYALLPTSAALLLGTASHIVWDAFTHASGWGVRLLPGLGRSVELGPALVAGFKVLQHGSSVVGLAVLAFLAWRWMSRQSPVSRRELLRRALAPGITLGLAAVLNGLRFLVDGIQQFVVAGGVAVTLTLGLGLVVLGLVRGARRVDVV